MVRNGPTNDPDSVAIAGFLPFARRYGAIIENRQLGGLALRPRWVKVCEVNAYLGEFDIEDHASES